MSSDEASSLQSRELLRLRREVKRLRYELGVSADQAPYLRALIEGAPDGLALTDHDGNILEYNQAMAELLEGDAQPPTRPISEYFTPLAAEAQSAPAGSSWAPFDLGALDSRPQRLWAQLGQSAVEIVVSRVYCAGSEVFLFAVRPLDDGARARRRLLLAETRLEELGEELQRHRKNERASRFEALSLLAGVLSHDLNNTLSVLSTSLALLADGPDEEMTRELIEDAQTGLQHVSGLVERLRNFNRGPASILNELDLAAWMPPVVERAARALGLRVRISTCTQPCVIDGDVSELERILVNLLTNAAQAGDGAPVEVLVELGRQAGGAQEGAIGHEVRYPSRPHVRLDVTDNAAGIPPAKLTEVFAPFYSSKDGGSGLGLASATGIISSHRGGISVSSEVGVGTRFTLLFPVSVSLSAEERGGDRAEGGGLEGSSVLVLEDDDAVRRTLEKWLERMGASVFAFATGEEAVSAYESLRAEGKAPLCLFDLVISGGMGGTAALSKIRERWPDVRAIACSGHDEGAIATTYAEIGFSAYLAKPFRAKELRRVVSGDVRALEGAAAEPPGGGAEGRSP